MFKKRPYLPAAFALGAAFVLSGCETAAETAADTVEKGLRANLAGAQEVPGPGDPDGSGSAEITIIDAVDNVCFDIKVRNIAAATMAHIHRGAAGVAGPVVVPLEAPADGDSKGCTKADGALADEIEANPAGFYVNVHNAEFPAGAIRGQLQR